MTLSRKTMETCFKEVTSVTKIWKEYEKIR